jgi:hypothetical protein
VLVASIAVLAVLDAVIVAADRTEVREQDLPATVRVVQNVAERVDRGPLRPAIQIESLEELLEGVVPDLVGRTPPIAVETGEAAAPQQSEGLHQITAADQEVPAELGQREPIVRR